MLIDRAYALMGSVAVWSAQDLDLLFTLGARRLPGSLGDLAATTSHTINDLGMWTARELGETGLPIVGPLGRATTAAAERRVINPLTLRGQLFKFFAAPAGIIARDLTAQLDGLRRLAGGDRLPLMRAWRQAARSAGYPIRYAKIYDHVPKHWRAALADEGVPLFAPSPAMIAAAEATRAASPTRVFALLDAAGKQDPDPRALERAVRADAAELTLGLENASEHDREYAAAQRMERRVAEQILEATRTAPAFLFRALESTREVEDYIRRFDALPKGALAPLPPAAFRLLIYVATANNHAPDGANVPITPEQSDQAKIVLDHLLVSVLGEAKARKFPGHSRTLVGPEAAASWIEQASKK